MQIYLLLFVIFWCIKEGASYTCRTCASPVLADEWGATGLPSRPDTNTSYFFDEHCERDLTSVEECETQVGCFEATYAVAGQYAMVRGCLEQFTDGYEELRGSLTPACVYAKGLDAVFVQKKHIETPYIGFSICTGGNCNHVLTPDHATQEIWGQMNGVITCQRKDSVRCVQCKYYDGYGHCWWDTRDYCSGAFCTKNIGTLNGRRYEIRGCSGIRPLNADYCFNVQDEHEILFLGERLVFKNDGTQCVCEGGTCNGVRRTGVYLGTVMVLLISWVLY